MQWIYLQQLLGYGAANAKKVLDSLEEQSDILSFDIDVAKKLGFTAAQINRLSSITLNEAVRIANLCKEKGIRVISYYDPDYPNKLREISSPPVVLYTLGRKINFDKEFVLACVGSRKAGENEKKAAFSVGAKVCLAGGITVSGGAVGADSCCHLGSLSVGGRTVVVTGGGVASDYLRTNRNLRNDALNHGSMLLSEFSPDYVPRYKNSFTVRNRIIAGLSDCAVIIETTGTGGTVITGKEVIKQKKPIYILENKDVSASGRLKNFKPFVGLREMLSEVKTEKPLDIDAIDDVEQRELDRLYNGFNIKEEKAANTLKKQAPQKPIEKAVNIPDDLREIYDLIVEESTVDEIAQKSNLTVSRILSSLTRLEILGVVKAMPGARYRIK